LRIDSRETSAAHDHKVAAGAGGKSVKNTLRKHKYAILLAALIWVALVESFSNRQVLGPNLSDLVIVAVMLLVFLIVFDRWMNRLVALYCIGHRRSCCLLCPLRAACELFTGTRSVGLSQRGACAGRFRDLRDPAKYLRAAHRRH
jgi:polyferredoxin